MEISGFINNLVSKFIAFFLFHRYSSSFAAFAVSQKYTSFGDIFLLFEEGWGGGRDSKATSSLRR